jgi:hypothetical protein
MSYIHKPFSKSTDVYIEFERRFSEFERRFYKYKSFIICFVAHFSYMIPTTNLLGVQKLIKE